MTEAPELWPLTSEWKTITKEEWAKSSYDVQYKRNKGEHPIFHYSAIMAIDPTNGPAMWNPGLPPGWALDFKSGTIIPVTTAIPVQPVADARVPKFDDIVEAKVIQAEKGTPFIDTNPKTAFGAVKPGSFQTPMVPFYEYSLAHYQGALKYGHYNWREDPVSISTYIEAARRHIDLFLEGQKEASDTGIHNLAHAMTCLSIVIDAEWYGTLINDRSTFGNAQKMEEYFESKKAMRQKIAADWTGHAEQLKSKLAASKTK